MTSALQSSPTHREALPDSGRLDAQIGLSGTSSHPSVTAYGSCEPRYPDRLTSVQVRRPRQANHKRKYNTVRWYNSGPERLKPCPTSFQTGYYGKYAETVHLLHLLRNQAGKMYVFCKCLGHSRVTLRQQGGARDHVMCAVCEYVLYSTTDIKQACGCIYISSNIGTWGTRLQEEEDYKLWPLIIETYHTFCLVLYMSDRCTCNINILYMHQHVTC